MEKLYLTIIVVLCFILIVKQFSSFGKKHDDNHELGDGNTTNEKIEPLAKETIQPGSSEIVQCKTILPGKNTWLYPSNELCAMKESVVYNSITYYSSNIKEESTT